MFYEDRLACFCGYFCFGGRGCLFCWKDLPLNSCPYHFKQKCISQDIWCISI